MKIAIYQLRASYYVGGGEVVSLEHARYLSALDHQITLVTTRASFIIESDYFKRFKKENPQITIQYIKVPERLRWIYRTKPGINWKRWDLESCHVGGYARAFFDKNRYDIIALHNILDSLAAPSDVPSALHLHGCPPAINYMQELALTIPWKCIAVSQFVKKEWKRLVPWLHNLAVGTNGIDSTRFCLPKSEAKKYDVLFVGRLLANKGIFDAVEAIKILKSTLNIQMAIAGAGPEKKKIQRLVKKYNLSKNIHLLGYISDDKLVALYQGAKIAVLPSTDREGILTTMLEAASCGVPVITCDACSMSEFVTHNKTGILVPTHNSKRIAGNIRLLLTNETLRDRIAVHARLSIEKKWDWHIKIQSVEKIYERILRHR